MSRIFLIPSPLDEDATECIPPYVFQKIKTCSVIFAENERTARRFLRKADKTFPIDDYEWFHISKENTDHERDFANKIRENKNIAVISEAGCPGIADPGQSLVRLAQKMNCEVIPLIGPISLMLALMGSGMNGQHFQFSGYLPIEAGARNKMIRELEGESAKKDSTQIFIETPYRNNALLDALLAQCRNQTRLCVAVNITGTSQSIRTMTIQEWKKQKPDLHKQPTVFLLHAGQ